MICYVVSGANSIQSRRFRLRASYRLTRLHLSRPSSPPGFEGPSEREHKKLQDLIFEGVNLMLQRYGEKPIA